MNVSDKARFSAAVAGMFETLGREATTPQLRGYWMALGDLPIEAVERACLKAIRQCRFAPVPAELRQLAGEASPSDAAARAWDSVNAAIDQVGTYRGVSFSDPIINATVRHLGGWKSFGDRSVEEFEKWLRKDFLSVYEGFLRTGIDAHAARSLGGIGDAKNAIEFDCQTKRAVATALRLEARPSDVPRVEFQKP